MNDVHPRHGFTNRHTRRYRHLLWAKILRNFVASMEHGMRDQRDNPRDWAW